MPSFLPLLAAAALSAAPAQPAAPAPPPAAPAPSAPAPSAAEAPLAAPGGTLSLDEALAQAQSGSLDLQVARARLAQAQQLSARAWAGYLPTLTVGGSITRNNVAASISQPTGYAIRDCTTGCAAPGGGAPTPPPAGLPGQPTPYALVPTGYVDVTIQPLTSLGAQAQLSQAVLAPALIPAIRAADLSVEAAGLSTESARREVLFAVAQGYYGVATLQEALRVSEQLLASAQAHERVARTQEQAGAAPRLARLRAELERSRAEQDVVRARNALASARLALAALLNRPADFAVASPPEVALPEGLETQEGALADALQSRPDVAAARTQAEAARAQRTVAALRYAPNVGLTARYNLTNAAGFAGRNDTWAVGLGVNWTLFDGGLREADLRDAAARVAEAEAARAQLERRTADELARARLELTSARANAAKAEDAVRLARESQDIAERSFLAGAASSLEVTDATTSRASAEVSLLTERLNAQLASLRLLRAAGLFAAN
jgi:outer membrane protein TolC